MLNPHTLTDAIVTTLQTNSGLMAAVDNNISANHYLYGVDKTLALAIQDMKAPSILVYFEGTQGGNFDGYTIWKHRFCVVIRAANQAGQGSPVGYEDIWHLICSGPVNGGSLNIRSINIVDGVDLMDTPSLNHMTDANAEDYFVAQFVLPEIGDN